ncbi:MAG: hypothetical protein RL358_1872 [Pseudomonadota bacterium]|jgi:hypothetical protein
MKNRLLLLSTILVALGLSACAALVPNQYAVPKAKLESRLQQSFPLQREVGKGLMSVSMNAPVLNLLADKNRVELLGDFAVHSLLVDTLAGRFSVSGSLRYDRTERAVYMQDAQLDTLQMSTDASAAEMLRPFLNAMLRDYLNSTPLYHFQPDELRFAGTEIDINAIQIQADAIVFKLQAKPH